MRERKPRTVTRFVVTNMDRHGLRTLTLGFQGRDTFETKEAAAEWMSAFLTNNGEERIRECYGEQAVGTFEVRPCECYARHFDPVGCYFD